MSVYYMDAWFIQRPEEGVKSPRTGVADGCKLPCECWGLNPGPVGQQPMHLTA